MPRPKRLKVAPSAYPPRLSTNSTIIVEVQELPSEARAGYIDMTQVSDIEDKAGAPVVKRGRGRPPKKKPQQVEDQPSEPIGSRAGGQHVAPEALTEDSLMRDIELESSSPSVELGRRGRHSTAFESSVLSISNFRRKPRQKSILGRGQAQAQSSSVESNRPDGNLVGMSSRNTSTFSLGNFKRRPRQPSILGQRARSSSVGLDTDKGTPVQHTSVLNLGNFERRARESSVLGTSRKPQQDRAIDEDDDDDFNPEDESTPLKLAKAAPDSISPASTSSHPRKRKLSVASESQPTSEAQSSTVAEELDTIVVPGALGDNVAQEYNIPSSPPEPPIPSIEGFNLDPSNRTMAPPQSSSSPPDSPLHSSPPPSMMPRFQSQDYQPRGRRPFRGRTPLVANQDSPLSSPPPLTHSPNRPARDKSGVTPAAQPRGRWQAAPPSTFSTAQLQTLLPRRRRQANRDPYEIDSSEDEVDMAGIAPDNDELTNLSVVPQSRRTAKTFIRRPAPLKKPGRPRNPSKSRAQLENGKVTYGSRANPVSDKENEEYDPNHSLAPLPDDADGEANHENSRDIGNVKELKEAAKKFKEVDQWELEFEEVTASSSSPLGAR